MRRWLAFLLALALGVSLMACGRQSGAEGQPAPAQEETQQDPPAQDTPTPEEEAQEPAAEESEGDSSQSAELATPEETEVARYANQDGYDAPCVFRPEKDGVYRFLSTNPSYEMEMYDPDAILWSVYVLDEEFEDGWRYLSQAYRPAIDRLQGEITVELKAGQYVYCIPSVNSFTGDPAEDNAASLTITLTNAEYGPAASNGWIQPVSMNAQCQYDLDGDGKADRIYYAIGETYEDEDGVWHEATPMSLQVNDQEFLDTEDEYNPFHPFDIWLENPSTEWYFLVDLDSSDDFVELAVCDWGSNDYTMTLFFRYEDGKLTYLGAISGTPESESTTYHGDGTVSAYDRFDVMQTWGGIVNYQLTDGKMEQEEGEMVQPRVFHDFTVTLKKPLTVYAEADKSSEKLTLQPDGKPLTFPLTDTEHWVQIVCADGTTGWAYFEQSYLVENDGQTVEDTEIFDGLVFGG